MTSFRITEITASWLTDPDALDVGQIFREGIIRTELNAVSDGHLDITANIFIDFLEKGREEEVTQLRTQKVRAREAEPVARLTAVARIVLNDPLIKAETFSGLPKGTTAEAVLCDLPWSTRRRLDILVNDDVLIALSAMARAMGLPSIQVRGATTRRLHEEISYVLDETDNMEQYESEREA